MLLEFNLSRNTGKHSEVLPYLPQKTPDIFQCPQDFADLFFLALPISPLILHFHNSPLLDSLYLCLLCRGLAFTQYMVRQLCLSLHQSCLLL